MIKLSLRTIVLMQSLKTGHIKFTIKELLKHTYFTFLDYEMEDHTTLNAATTHPAPSSRVISYLSEKDVCIRAVPLLLLSSLQDDH